MTGRVVPDEGATEVGRIFRAAYSQAVATLVRVFGDITLAEDAVQDAFTIATDRWRSDGIPPNPAGWIVTTARNRAIDRLRRESRGRELDAQRAVLDQPAGRKDEGPVNDDQLRLIFTCCHPALRTEHRVALTLRLLGGLSVEEVARSFLVSEDAMAKRLVRAKCKIKEANIPYRVPREEELPARLGAVLAVLYLIYNTGVDDPERAELRADAVRLARTLVGLMPDEPEAAGLLALVLLSESRADARRSDGAPVLLRDQDRSRWDLTLIEEGHAILRACIRRDRPGPYQLQAAIQAVHCAAPTFHETDWEQIVLLYDQLFRLTPTAIVALNRAIAIGETEGPAATLQALDSLGSGLDDYPLLHAARGTALRRLGRLDDARGCFERAAELTGTEPDRMFLLQQVDALSIDESG